MNIKSIKILQLNTFYFVDMKFFRVCWFNISHFLVMKSIKIFWLSVFHFVENMCCRIKEFWILHFMDMKFIIVFLLNKFPGSKFSALWTWNIAELSSSIFQFLDIKFVRLSLLNVFHFVGMKFLRVTFLKFFHVMDT